MFEFQTNQAMASRYNNYVTLVVTQSKGLLQLNTLCMKTADILTLICFRTQFVTHAS